MSELMPRPAATLRKLADRPRRASAHGRVARAGIGIRSAIPFETSRPEGAHHACEQQARLRAPSLHRGATGQRLVFLAHLWGQR
jgi:hypothetical protein